MRRRSATRAGLAAGALFLRLRAPVLAVLLTAFLAACASLPPAPRAEAVQVASVPAFVQQDLQCGPAALASLLVASGVPTSPEALMPDLFIPARGGSLQVELAAQARQRGRVPLLLGPSEGELIAALEAGQPVLLLLNLGLRSRPTWHYAVLTGYDPARGYLLHAGRAEAEVYTRRQLLRRWDWAGRWALTLHPPEAPPSYASPAQWISGLAPLERSQPLVAETGYAAAIARWPDSGLAHAALGTRRIADGDAQAAALLLREAARLAPADAAIANNLASAELARGCVARAEAALAGVDASAQPAAVATALAGTRQEIEAAKAAGLRCGDQ